MDKDVPNNWREYIKPMEKPIKKKRITTWDEYIKLLSKIRNNAIVEWDLDFIVVHAGSEGSGKSTVAKETGKKMDGGSFTIKNINMDALDFVEWEIAMAEGELPPGSINMFDEGGTQMFSRDANSKENKILVRQFIQNRYLNGFHFILVPKLSYLDKYMREERIDMLVWCWFETDNEYSEIKRYMAVYYRDSINYILSQPYWWRAFRSSIDLMRFFPPDIKMRVPDFKQNSQIDIDYIEKKKDWNKKDFYKARDDLIKHRQSKEDEDNEFLDVENHYGLSLLNRKTGISMRKLRDMCAVGEINATKNKAGKWVIPESEVRRFVVDST